MENKKINYGSVLKVTRRDTLDDIRKNFALMREYGLDTVVIWPSYFWWEEKTEFYPFNTGRKILEIAEEYGIKIIMELAGQLTSMEYMPDFLNKPEYYPVNREGHREYAQASFGFVNYFHPEVKAIITDIYKKAAIAYKDYSSLIGYDVFNETMYRSFDKYTIADFQSWLREKYGTIEKLNEVWERTFLDFSQIYYENWKWLSIMPESDYTEYRKAAISRFIKPWCDAIREIDGEHFLIADNIGSQSSPHGAFDRPQDDYGLADFADIIGMSFYPKLVSGTIESAMRWEYFDGYYDASRRKGFYISELQTHIQSLFTPTSSVLPHELKHWVAEAYAGGAKGMIYWMWRPFDSGLQTLGRGLVNHEERATERLEMAKIIGKEILSYGEIKPVRSRIAILYDPNCENFQQAYTSSVPADKITYNNSIFGAYKAFFNIGVRCDIVRIDEIADYDALIITNGLIFDNKTMSALGQFVTDGGHIIMDGRSGIVNEYAVRHRSLPGGSFNKFVGETYFDTDNRDNLITSVYGTIKSEAGRLICEVTDGEIVGTFPDGKAAIVRKQTGKGDVNTINTALWHTYIESNDETIANFAAAIADVYDLRQTISDGRLKLRVSEDSENYYLFAFNYTEDDITAEVDVRLCGKTVSVSVPANDIVITKIAK